MGYSPTQGRWLEQDPDTYVDGPNVYQLEISNPINRLDPQGTGGATATTQPSAGEAARQLSLLRIIGAQFSLLDASWSLENQCDLQAANLQAAILKDKQWDAVKPKLWDIGTTGGTGKYRFARHNVVLLTPKNGNPLPPMILDSFHGPQRPLTGRGCPCKTLQNFRKEYPAPIDADPWYIEMWKHLPFLDDL